jgi:osmotically-inducible protein OsmY
MKLLVGFLWAALLAGGCTGASTSTPERTAREEKVMSDSELAAAVQRRLILDNVPNAARFKIACAAGVVTLQGEVPSGDASAAAEKSARGVAGVTSVKNQLTVRR